MPSVISNTSFFHFENVFKQSRTDGFFKRIFKKYKSKLLPQFCEMCGTDVIDPKQRFSHRKACRFSHIVWFSKYLITSRIHELKLNSSSDTKLLDLLCNELLKINVIIEKEAKKLKSKQNQTLDKMLGINISNFEFIRPLTKGGFGQIFLVKDNVTQKYLVAKVLSISEAIQRECLESYVSEREILLKCNSEYIVSMYYSFRSEFFIYEILEYMESGDLSSHLEISTIFNEDTVRSVLVQIFLALKELQRNSIVHGDIKLENILYSYEKKLVKLADFGLAFEGEDNPFKPAHGTPEYMAPEQVLNSQKSFKSDMWAVGICAYEMLFGIPPYFDDNATNILYKIVNEKNINWQGADISNEAKDLISRLLDPNPNSRLSLEEAMSHEFFALIDWDNPTQVELCDFGNIFEERNKRYSTLQFYNINTISTETVAFEEGVFNQNTTVENQINLLKLFPIKNLNKLCE